MCLMWLKWLLEFYCIRVFFGRLVGISCSSSIKKLAQVVVAALNERCKRQEQVQILPFEWAFSQSHNLVLTVGLPWVFPPQTPYHSLRLRIFSIFLSRNELGLHQVEDGNHQRPKSEVL